MTVDRCIWAFDLDGSLVWKIPEAYPEADQIARGVPENKRIHAGYVGFFLLANGTVKGITDEGNRVVVRISDGALISRSEASKM